MKVLILGGFGMSGSYLARDLVDKPEIEKIILADKTLDMNKIDKSFQNNKKISFQVFDMLDYVGLVRLIKGNDVVVNCVGPFYKYGVEPMKAAIEAGVNYVDICDDADVINDAFTLDALAKAAHVTICVGCGNSPGFSNAVIKNFADKLEAVDEIGIFVGVGLGGGFGPGVLYHIFHCLMDCNLQFIDGKLQKPDDLGKEELDFLEPIGKCEVTYFGHPEPLTLPRYIKGVNKVVFKLGNLPTWFNEWLLKSINLGFASLIPMKVRGAEIMPRDLTVSLLSNSTYFDKEIQTFDTANRFFIIKGREGDKKIIYTIHVSKQPKGMTALCCSVVTQMLCKHEIKEFGILSPEAFMYTEDLLPFLKTKGLKIQINKTENIIKR
jgi:lysine 6-dehydrogenase